MQGSRQDSRKTTSIILIMMMSERILDKTYDVILKLASTKSIHVDKKTLSTSQNIHQAKNNGRVKKFNKNKNHPGFSRKLIQELVTWSLHRSRDSRSFWTAILWKKSRRERERENYVQRNWKRKTSYGKWDSISHVQHRRRNNTSMIKRWNRPKYFERNENQL